MNLHARAHTERERLWFIFLDVLADRQDLVEKCKRKGWREREKKDKDKEEEKEKGNEKEEQQRKEEEEKGK